MLNRLLPQSWLPASFTIVIVAAFFLAAPSSLSASRPPRGQIPVRVFITDTGKTVALSAGQVLVVEVPLTKPETGNSWFVSVNSGAPLKLIAGPDELRGRDWAPGKEELQVFYFIGQSPGTTHLVMERKYPTKPMILTVVER